MSARDLLAELDVAGVSITREGDNLKVRGEPGVSLDPYLDRIRECKPALLAELLQVRISEALNVERELFDRETYDRLWVLWYAQDAREESTP